MRRDNGSSATGRLASFIRRNRVGAVPDSIGGRGLPSDPPRSGPYSVQDIRADNTICCVSVLLYDFASDFAALEQAIDLASATNARLLVIAAPQFPRLLAGWSLGAGVPDGALQPVDVYENDAILRADRLVRSRVPHDLPVTIHGVPDASPKTVANIVIEANAEIVVIPSARNEQPAPISLRWHVRRYERAISLRTALREVQLESADVSRVFVLNSSETRRGGTTTRRKLRELAALTRRSARPDSAAT
jgi:hypothetical protein